MLSPFRYKLRDHLHARIRDAENMRLSTQSPTIKEYWAGKLEAYKELQAINNGELKL